MTDESDPSSVRTWTWFYDEQKRVVAQYDVEEPTERCADCGGTGEIVLLTTRRKCLACHGLGLQPAGSLTSYTYYDDPEIPSVASSLDPSLKKKSPSLEQPPQKPEQAFSCRPQPMQFKRVQSWDKNGKQLADDAFIFADSAWRAIDVADLMGS